MNILYLHGLESKLSAEKRIILEHYGQVIAPDIDYNSNPNIIQLLHNTYKNQDIKLIIGSSMGGFVGYYLSAILGLSCMLYNPALPYRNNILQKVPSNLPFTQAPLVRIVLGGCDNTIKAKDNLNFLAQNYISQTDYNIIIRNDLSHQIPLNVFEEETKSFFESLSY